MKTFTDEEGNQYELVGKYANPGIVIKPVKKTEKQEEYILSLHTIGKREYSNDIDLTPATANKLSEAITAVVEYVQLEKGVLQSIESERYAQMCFAADRAREAYQNE
jgi:hypothetical protein